MEAMRKALFPARWLAEVVLIGALLGSGAAVAPATAPFPRDHFIQESFDHRNSFPLALVSAIAQTPDGYLWLAGDGRILRYDGIQFEPIGNAHGRLLVDRSGTLWYGKPGELVSYRGGRFTRHPYPAGMTILTGINALTDDRRGNVWIAVDRGPLLQFDQERFTVHRGVSSPTALAQDQQGALWVGTQQHGLFRLQEGAFRHLKGWAGETVPSIRCLAIDRENRLWAGTGSQGLIGIRTAGPGSPAVFSRLSMTDGLPFNLVTCLETDGDGVLLVGTSNGVCRTTRRADGGLVVGRTMLTGTSILTLHIDREGSLWAGTLTRGVIRLRPGRFRYERDFPAFSPTLHQSPDGSIWIGTVLGDLIRYRAGRKSAFQGKNRSEDHSILSIAEAGGQLYLGTSRAGLFQFTAGRMRRPSGFPREQNLGVLAILADSRGRLLVGTTSGLRVRQDGRLRHFGSADILLDNWVYTLFEDKARNIWIGSAKGAAAFANGDLRGESRRVPLQDIQVLDIHQDSLEPERMWFCTLSGLRTVRGDRSFTYNKGNGLGSDLLHQLVEDGRGHFWISSRDGLLRVSRRELLDYADGHTPRYGCLRFGRPDGLAPILSHRPQRSIIRTPRGEIWTSTSEGIAIIETDVPPWQRPEPLIALKELVVDGQRIADHARPQFRGAKNLAFSLALLTFIDQGESRLEYRLEGRDREWSSLEPRQRTIRYQGLPAGSYTLVVRSRNREGYVDPGGFRFDFHLVPRFFESAIFFALLGLVLAGGFAAAIWLRGRLRLLGELQARQQAAALHAPDPQTNLTHHQLLVKLETDKVYRDEEITLQTLARTLKVQPWELSRVINVTMNMNFWTLINGYRIREARERLANMPGTGQSILTICYEVGFSSKSSFYRAFKKHTGMTPNEYLSSIRPRERCE